MLAAVLSFIWPGLGQWAQGRRAVALGFALPVVVVAVALIGLVSGGLTTLAVKLLDPSLAAALLVLVVAMGIWRIAAMADVLRRSRAAPLGRRGWSLIAVLVLVVVASHALAGSYLWSFYQAGSTIFVSDATPSPSPTPLSPTPEDSGLATDTPLSSPTPSPTPASARISVLLIGADSGTGYTHSLTDTMIVATFDPTTGQAVMLSLPRDTSDFPLYDGTIYAGKLNSLVTFASADPRRFPAGGYATLQREVGYLLGVQIQYYAFIDMAGFQQMVETVGGIDLVVQRAIADPGYGWPNHTFGFFLSAGKHHLDGLHALAYVRSRMGAGDNDFTRAARQQNLLDALKTKLLSPAVLPRVPAFLNALSRAVRTNLPPSKLASLMALAQGVTTGSIQHYVLGPPYTYHPPTNQTGGIYTLQIEWSSWRDLCVKVFGSDTSYAPAPTPAPTATPTP